MTDNQEKELFKTLATLVTGIQKIQDTQSEHSLILNEHSLILNEHSRKLDEHSRKLDRLEAKTDSIAGAVIKSDGRLANIETEVEVLKSGIH